MSNAGPSQAECIEAAEIMAGITVFAYRDPAYDIERRKDLARNLALACSLCIDPQEDLTYEIYRRLVGAGAEQAGATQLAQTLTQPTEIRKTFALIHVVQDQPRFGFRLFGKGNRKEEEPKKFVDAILGLKER